MKNNLHSGWHLIVDAFVADPGRISCPDSIRNFMTDLVGLLKMEILDGPRITEVPLDTNQLATESDDGGITGYCLITTSHIAIHTWPLRNRFCLDVFSCKEFSGEEAESYLREFFGVTQAEVTWLARSWPRQRKSTRRVRTPLAALPR